MCSVITFIDKCDDVHTAAINKTPYTLFGISIMRMNHVVVLIRIEKQDTVFPSVSRAKKLYIIYRFLGTHTTFTYHANRASCSFLCPTT